MVNSSFNSDYYEDDENKKSLLGKFKLIFGASSLVFSVIIFFSLLSYFFTGFDDQSLINSGISFSTFGDEAMNWLGVLGAFTAHYFIYVLFGISSFILVPLLITTAFKFLFGFKIFPLTKTFVFSVFTLIWVSSTMGFFLNLFPESFILRNYTGGIGYTLALFLDNLLGYSSILILLLSLFIFIVFFFDFYSFNLKFLSKTSKNNNLNSEDIIEDSEEIIVEEEMEEEMEEEIEEEEYNDEVSNILNDKNKINETTENQDLELKVEKTQDEKTSMSKIGDVYDPELDLSSYKYPKVDLLNESKNEKIQVTKDELTSNKNRIIETLKNFKIEIAKIKATIGPTVTLYEIVPEAGIKISKIKNLEDDIALSLSLIHI
mgnify:FL=1